MIQDVFLQSLKDLGFAGVQNFPTVGLIDGTFRANLEETGMGYGLEVDMIKAAHELDMLTTPYVFSEDDARAMAVAGADIIVPHMGLTTGGSIGADTALKLEDCPALIDRLGRGGKVGASRHHRALPRRADQHAGGRALHPRQHRELQRLLRRLLDGAPADGSRAHRTDERVQTHRRRPVTTRRGPNVKDNPPRVGR